MKRVELAIVGAGAAGLMAAVEAGERLGDGVLLLDANPKPGKKLLATGNGRCNLSNRDIRPERYHGDPLAGQVLSALPENAVAQRFQRLGLLTREDGEGRIYPNSLQAAAVLQCLWGAAARLGVRTAFGSPVEEILPGGEGFALRTAAGERFTAARVLLCCGGKAGPGKLGGGYALARSLGHGVTPLRPSLCPLRTPDRLCRALKGNRVRAAATLYRNGVPVGTRAGEVLFGDGQLSGICVFELSALLEGPGGWAVGLDLLDRLDREAVLAYLLERRALDPGLPAGELFAGALNLRLGGELVKRLGLAPDTPLGAVDEAALGRAAALVKDLRIPVTGPAGWESAQVTAGGVPLREIDPETMASRMVPGLYLAGELLDVDGDCGGFNLHWAWTTGMLAARAAGEESERPC